MKKSQLCQKKFLCRLCNSKKLKVAIDLKSTPLANSFLIKKKLRYKENFFPLKVNFCSNCFHLQLSHSVSPDLMFKNYLYVSGTSEATIKHFKDYALSISKKFNTKIIKVLDIASNDGTFLKCLG